MKGFKKVVVGTMAATMLLSSSLVAFAADPTGDPNDPATGTTSGTGGLEGSVNKDVFKVVLPTISTGDTTFNFIADPEGLIKATSGAKYSGKDFEDGATLFFENDKTKGATYDYSSTSEALTITNKSTMDVDVTLEATVSAITGITLTSDSTFTNDKTASIYLALTDGTTPTAITSSGAEVTKKIDKAPTDAYEVKYDAANDKYTYELTTAASASDYTGFKKMDFQMTGKANAAGDWSQLTSMAPAVTITWSVVKHQDSAAPSIAQTSYALVANTELNIPVSLGRGDKAATGIASATFVAGDRSGDLTPFYSFENNTIKVTASAVDFLISKGGATFTITFNDTASTPVTVTVTAP